MQDFKKWLTATIGLISLRFGWIGWLFLLYAVSMLLDFATGSVLALKKGAWASSTARKKLWKKCGSLVAILAAGLVDLLIHLLTSNLPDYQLPFHYTTLFVPLVTIWYLIAEIGSIIENAASMGAPIPDFLRKGLSILNHSIADGSSDEQKAKNQKK